MRDRFLGRASQAMMDAVVVLSDSLVARPTSLKGAEAAAQVDASFSSQADMRSTYGTCSSPLTVGMTAGGMRAGGLVCWDSQRHSADGVVAVMHGRRAIEAAAARWATAKGEDERVCKREEWTR